MKKNDGASLIEVLVALFLIGVSLGAIFKLNNSAIDEMRALKEHHFAQNAVHDLVKKTRLYYDSSLQNIYRVSGNGTAYPSADCTIDCLSIEVAQYDIQVWTQELQTQLHNVQYSLFVSNDSVLEIAISWESRGQQPTQATDCPIELEEYESCFVLFAILDE